MSDPIAVAISYVYVGSVIAAGESLRHWAGWSPDFTRKFIHIGVGMWAVGTALLFQRWQYAVIPPMTFIVINYVSYRRKLIKAMDAVAGETLGTVYFPISFALLIPVFWPDQRVLFVAALMPMTWGDALAAVVGQRIGNRSYRLLGHHRSWEGTLTMLVASFVTVWLALAAFGDSGATFYAAPAAATAGVAAAVEATSPWGIDNITVPLASAASLALLL